MMRKRGCAVLCTLAVMTSSMIMGVPAMAQEELIEPIAIPYLEEGAFDEIAMTNDDTVRTGINIRSAADEDSEVVGYLYRGGAAWIINKGEKWTEVYSGGLTGFIKNEYLVFGNDVRGLAEYYGLDGVTTTWEDVKLFSAQSSDSAFASLETGDDLILLEDFGHWLQVQYGADSVAYVSVEDVTHVKLLETAVDKDSEYRGRINIAAGLSEDIDTEQDYSGPSYDDYDYSEPDYDYSTPETSAPSYTPETSAPSYTTPETSAPETSAPETSAPETSAPETSAPETSAPETEAPADDTVDDSYIDEDDADIDTGSDGYYDADNDIYYDGNGNVIDNPYDSQESYTEESYEEETYVEETYVEESYEEEIYVEETYEDTYTEDTYVEETEAASSSSDDTSLLAALIYCEAGNQSYEGMVAVGAVVMNRVYSSSFPNSISEVIYQSGQFTPAYSGSLASALASGVPSTCYDAAVAAINGENPVGSALYFNTGSGKGIKIGDHQFY